MWTGFTKNRHLCVFMALCLCLFSSPTTVKLKIYLTDMFSWTYLLEKSVGLTIQELLNSSDLRLGIEFDCNYQTLLDWGTVLRDPSQTSKLQTIYCYDFYPIILAPVGCVQTEEYFRVYDTITVTTWRQPDQIVGRHRVGYKDWAGACSHL